MKNRYMKIITFIAAALLFADTAVAIEIDMEPIGFPIEKIDVHGFFGQGYMVSTNNNVYGDTKTGTLDLRDFGMNFSGNLTEDIRLSVQFAGYSLGGQGGDQINLHYGYFDYRMIDEFGIRLGRVRVPAGLYNETRDIDMLRTSVFLPQSVYPEYYRDYFASADLVCAYGGLDLENLGFLSYQSYVGTVPASEDPTSDVPYYMDGLGLTDTKINHGRTYGAQLLWDTPIEGLRTSWTWRRTDITISSVAQTPYGPFRMMFPVDNNATQVWSAEYQVDKLTLMGEYSHTRIDSVPNYYGWYGGANYELTDKLAVGGCYSRFSTEDPGSDLMANFQNSVSLYGKYNITDTWLVKGQIDMSRGSAYSQGLERSANDKVSNTMFSIKTSWSF